MKAVLINAIYQIISITSLWIVCLITKNGSWIDLGWPSGFVFAAILTLNTSPSNLQLKLLCYGYIICGIRFIIGWFLRRHYKHQDRRFNLWCDLWKDGKISWFGIRSSSIAFNYFIWFEIQAACNIGIFYAPLYAVSVYNNGGGISILEWSGIIIWCFAITIEHASDVQLANWKESHRKSKDICQDGLWFYSRHPNYFGEILVWLSYSTFALDSMLDNSMDVTLEYLLIMVMLFLSPYLMYRWLRYTAAWILEKASIKKRPKYAQYQATTNMIVPWFPSNKKK